MSAPPAILWFRNDLRLDDNPALGAAVAAGGSIVPVFVWSPGEEGEWAPGAASRWWLHRSLAGLDRSLRRLGSRLILRRGPSLEVLLEIASESGAGALYRNRRYEPAARAIDGAVDAGLRERRIATHDFNAALLFEPDAIANASGGPYQVFTPFFNACLAAPDPPPPAPAPRRLRRPSRWPSSLRLEALGLDPRARWAGRLAKAWQPGEASARRRFESFLDAGLASYDEDRDRPDRTGTSRLSPHLHFGEIGPRRLWADLGGRREASPGGARRASGHRNRRRAPGHRNARRAPGRRDERGTPVGFARQIVWREFAYHLMSHYPHTVHSPLRRQFARLARSDDGAALVAWQRGETGFPIVDAGMRELWSTGWMHNRVRMIAASFLVKDLLQPWQAGAKWFWDTLVDADLANNTLGWQWIAGCGADAAPFFRIFNPARQGAHFDPEGDYVRAHVPELARLPARYIHRPWEAPGAALAAAGIDLGRTYPRPIVDHDERRIVALAAYRDAVAAPRAST